MTYKHCQFCYISNYKHCQFCYISNYHLRTICHIETVKTLFKLTSWTNWLVPEGIIIKTGQFNLNTASSAMLVTLKRTICDIATVKTLSKLTSWTNWPVPLKNSH